MLGPNISSGSLWFAREDLLRRSSAESNVQDPSSALPSAAALAQAAPAHSPALSHSSGFHGASGSPDNEQARPSAADDADAPGRPIESRATQPRTKVLAVAEGLEEELFVAEAHRHDAEVCAAE